MNRQFKKVAIGFSVVKRLVTDQPCSQVNSCYPNKRRRLGTKREFSQLPTSLTGDVTSELTEGDWDEAGN